MPILAYETKKNMFLLDQIIQEISQGQDIPGGDLQVDLASAYIKHGLHPRRPLDHFSYTSRAVEQIMPTFSGSRGDNPTAPALMVDQLWLWMLEDGMSGFSQFFALLLTVGFRQ
jgi:hypothetical protein